MQNLWTEFGGWSCHWARRLALLAFNTSNTYGKKDSHSHPSPRLVVMPHNSRRLHLLLGHLVPRTPTSHTLKRMYLYRIIITRRRYLACRVERCMTHAQSALVLAYQSWQLPPRFTT